MPYFKLSHKVKILFQSIRLTKLFKHLIYWKYFHCHNIHNIYKLDIQPNAMLVCSLKREIFKLKREGVRFVVQA